MSDTPTLSPAAEIYAADIPQSVALAAFSGVSHFPERRAASTVRDYASTLAADLVDLQALAPSEADKETLAAEFARYREGFCKRYLAYLASNARCVSWFIAGPSKFPAHRMNKRTDVVHRRLNELFEFRKRALAAIRSKLCPSSGGPIMAGDKDAVERLQAKLEGCVALQERMRDANAAIRKHHKAGPEAQVQALVMLGFSPILAAKALKPDFCGRVGFPDYALSNNSAEIRRLKKRLEHVTAAKAAPIVHAEGSAARFEDNPADNRVRLFYPGKPSAEVRDGLKSHGFRWTPTLGAWQAYRNSSTIAYARTCAGLVSSSPAAAAAA